MANKKIVHYLPSENNFISEGMSAYVETLDHPNTSNAPGNVVRTTRVLKHDVMSGEFETLNTIYKIFD